MLSYFTILKTHFIIIPFYFTISSHPKTLFLLKPECLVSLPIPPHTWHTTFTVIFRKERCIIFIIITIMKWYLIWQSGWCCRWTGGTYIRVLIKTSQLSSYKNFWECSCQSLWILLHEWLRILLFSFNFICLNK